MDSISASEMEHPRSRYSITASTHGGTICRLLISETCGKAFAQAGNLVVPPGAPPDGRVVGWPSGIGTPMETQKRAKESMHDGASSGAKVAYSGMGRGTPMKDGVSQAIEA